MRGEQDIDCLQFPLRQGCPSSSGGGFALAVVVAEARRIGGAILTPLTGATLASSAPGDPLLTEETDCAGITAIASTFGQLGM
ncbi:MAG: hypothetical protein IH941_07360 [Acidobacteria bacterium]|nr:hypothetical protein [Acidobacteriota bacterium]